MSMATVTEIFRQGPQAVSELFAQVPPDSAWDDMDRKQLADICWTRANTLAKTQPADARKWAQAALAGYELLGRYGKHAAAESAAENAAALRSWRLVSQQ